MNTPNPYSAYSAVYDMPETPGNCPGCMPPSAGSGFTGTPQMAALAAQRPSSMQPSGNTLSARPSMPSAPAPSSTPMQQPAQENPLSPIVPWNQPIPVTADNIQYLNGFIRTQIGRPVKVDFLIGTNTLVDKSGTLVGVGANYILINETDTDDFVACDFYNIKFIKFYY